MEYLAALETAGFPPSDILVLGSNIGYGGVPGNPWYEPYSGRSPVMAEGPPPSGLNVVIAPGLPYFEFNKVVNETIQKGTIAPVFEVEYGKFKRFSNAVAELDPWNGLFLSIGIKVTKYILFGIVDYVNDNFL